MSLVSLSCDLTFWRCQLRSCQRLNNFCTKKHQYVLVDKAIQGALKIQDYFEAPYFSQAWSKNKADKPIYCKFTRVSSTEKKMKIG